MSRTYYHLHLLSDATGETLIAISRAAAAQYQGTTSIEHVYPMVRNPAQLEKIIGEIEAQPGIVLFTFVDAEMARRLTEACRAVGCPCLSVLSPILDMFQSYIGAAATPRAGAQHMLNVDYFKRIEALNFTMMHDDGQQPENLEMADVVLIGVSRTSKTPTSIYLANRGIKTANVPLVPDVAPPAPLLRLKAPLVVGLFASPERIVQIRQNRLLALNADYQTPYVDRLSVSEEIARSRKLFEEHGWPSIDVSRRSIEETAAEIINLHKARRVALMAQS
jgi:[pyruvate, water dikinase]-phosphate phosphotransferase / [pyruvate, water dikinase] kinase